MKDIVSDLNFLCVGLKAPIARFAELLTFRS